MAVQRITLAQIVTELFRISGFADSASAPWLTDANLYIIINNYQQRLVSRVAQVAAAAGIKTAAKIRLGMWKTQANLTATSGSSTVHFPTDYDQFESFYDNTYAKPIEAISEVNRWHIRKLRSRPSGPTEAIEILDYVSNAATWQRRALLWPTVQTGITPSISCTYWRIPAAFTGAGTEYPDGDYKYHNLWIYGPALEILRPEDPDYSRYEALEKELLLEIALTGTSAS